MKPIPWFTGRALLRDFRLTWLQLLFTGLLARILTAVVLMPVVGLLLKLFLARSARGVLSDEEIVLFFVRPIGLAAVVVVGAVWLAIGFAKLGGQMVIGFGAADQRRVTFVEAIKYVFAHAVDLVLLGGQLIVRLMVLVVPFVVGLGAVYLLLLRKHDINFYLTEKPSEWWIAVILGGLLAAGLAAVVFWRLTCWIVALPLVLIGGSGGRQALRASEKATATHRRRIAKWLAAWMALAVILWALVTLAVGLAGAALVPQISRNLVLVAVGVSTVLLLSGLGNLAVGFVTSALFALLTVHLYRSIAGPVELDAALAPRGSLGQKTAMRVSAKATLWGSAAALAVIIIATYLTVRDLHAEDHAEIIAHRGASAAAPENTMAAFERAIADHADWIELDVQESADGVVVVQHDSDFMKVAGVDLKIWDATQEDLRAIDVGSRFGPEFADQRVPTLREALELAKGKLRVLVELKYYGRDEDLEGRVIEVIEATGMESDIALMSLKYEGIRKAAALRPVWPHGFLSTVNVGDLTRLDVDFLALGSSAASRSVIRRAHKGGMKVYVWTVNDPIQMSVMLSRGVDGLITDEPALAHRVQELRADLSPFGRLLVWIAGEAGLLRGRVEISGEKDA